MWLTTKINVINKNLIIYFILGTISKTANMDDILIISLKCSDAASLWVDYFSNYFQQISKQANRKPFKIQYLGAEEAIKKSKEEFKELAEKSSGVKLQLVVLCPSFLEFISEHPDESYALGRLLLADRTLALLLGVTDNDLTEIHKKSHEEFPTLLHFATKFGLEKLAMQLLDCPGADIAYEIRNIYDMTPLEIAEANGYSELATMLRGYMNMNEFTSMYAKLKEISFNPKSPDVDEEGYLTPRNIQDFYKLCPAPRPVIIETTAIIETPKSECSSPLGGYMTMNTPVPIPKEEPTTHKHCPFDAAPEQKPIIETLEPVPKNTKLKKKMEVVEDKVQRELVEIINDFKNNVHSISQVETLVEEWKNRNDVQKII
ncbi:hypothetical protein NQ314_011919 [Rhamnusium bicolor]|uniref:DBB domain-containing protein n=1 Tax=Rhamnusium bicolor TaxID=1586634 RepID=A0AAV8XFH0_9CUCU|nr:hypothetical protein NQ314_011919 [Rhamnusium bicolor]